MSLKRPGIDRSFYRLISVVVCLFVLSTCGNDEAPTPPPPPVQPQAAEPTPAPQVVSPAVIQALQPAKMVVRPPSLHLGPTLPGSSTNGLITIANEGEENLTLREIRLDADQTELSVGGSCMERVPQILTKGQSCEVNIAFTPLAAGGDLIGELVITPEGNENAPAFIPVTASKATPATPPTPVVQGPSPELMAAVELYEKRKAGNLTILESAPDPGPGDIITKDLDYTPIGFAPTVSTLPVDRSRMITADKYINAVLENTINSQLAGGRIVGVIEQHVYGGDGRLVLLPAGSRAIGVYESLGRQGDTRLRASFVRVMRPDGAAISIEGDPAADVMGRLGMIGDVDNRYFERFAGPLLISMIGAIGTYATNSDTIRSTDANGLTTTSQTLTPEQQAYQNFATDLSFITQRLVEESINLAPIITIPGGTRFVIMPTRDMVMQGYNLVGVTPNPNNPQELTQVPGAKGQVVQGQPPQPQQYAGGNPPAPVNARPGAAQPGARLGVVR
jgi:type IV secretion system protein VirB10